MIVNYDCKTFIVQATSLAVSDEEKGFMNKVPGVVKMSCQIFKYFLRIN